MMEHGSVTPQLRLFLRKNLPEPLRMSAALCRRELRDRVQGLHRVMVRDVDAAQPFADTAGRWTILAETEQAVRSGALADGKRHNLGLGIARIDGMVLLPGQIFSFWKLVGRPSEGNGFRLGRGIRRGILQEDLGGGLCQLSGLIYNLGLMAGLEVIERQPHSRDIYTEEERVVPLGLDATVVWPWKDLRLRNGHAHPVRMALGMEEDRLHGAMEAAGPIVPMTVHTSRVDIASRRLVTVERGVDGQQRELVSRDEYRIGAMAPELAGAL